MNLTKYTCLECQKQITREQDKEFILVYCQIKGKQIKLNKNGECK